MEQPKDFAEFISENDIVMELTHKEVVRLRISIIVSFLLGFIAGSLIF